MTADDVRAANAMQEPPSHNLTEQPARIYERAKDHVRRWDPFRGVTTRALEEE